MEFFDVRRSVGIRRLFSAHEMKEALEETARQAGDSSFNLFCRPEYIEVFCLDIDGEVFKRMGLSGYGREVHVRLMYGGKLGQDEFKFSNEHLYAPIGVASTLWGNPESLGTSQEKPDYARTVEVVEFIRDLFQGVLETKNLGVPY